MAETDPKSVQDLTNVVQTLLQQMQDKFQTMSDQIIGRIDEMSTRIDDLEKNIADLMTQAGVEEIEAAPEKAKEGQGSSWRFRRSKAWSRVLYSGAADLNSDDLYWFGVSLCDMLFYILNIVINGYSYVMTWTVERYL